MQKFDLKVVEEYKAPVTKVAAFETDTGIGNRCGDAREREETGGC